jgi:hypothetical protein
VNANSHKTLQCQLFQTDGGRSKRLAEQQTLKPKSFHLHTAMAKQNWLLFDVYHSGYFSPNFGCI